MATIVNARDLILQAAIERLLPVSLPPNVTLPAGQVGPGSLSDSVKGAGGNTIVHQGNFQAQTVVADQVDARGLTIKTPSGQIVVDASRRLSRQDLTDLGVFAALSTLDRSSGLLTGFGTLAGQNSVSLTSQVTGSLSAGSVSGLGALALANVVNLSTQTVGALNGYSQVTNLGSLAYAESVAANQIGAGTLAAGVAYIGSINASQVNAGNLMGVNVIGAGRVAAGAQMGAGSYQFDASSAFGPFVVRILGADLSVRPGLESGSETLLARADGSVVTLGPVELRINANYFAGSLGSRIMLTGVTYTVTLNGNQATFS